jgi:hypothetical protein
MERDAGRRQINGPANECFSSAKRSIPGARAPGVVSRRIALPGEISGGPGPVSFLSQLVWYVTVFIVPIFSASLFWQDIRAPYVVFVFCYVSCGSCHLFFYFLCFLLSFICLFLIILGVFHVLFSLFILNIVHVVAKII